MTSGHQEKPQKSLKTWQNTYMKEGLAAIPQCGRLAVHYMHNAAGRLATHPR